MRLPITWASIIVVLATVACHAGTDQPVKNKEDQLAKQLTFFYRNPTEAEFKKITSAISKQEAEVLKNRHGFALLAATFIARAHQKYGFKIPAEGSIFKMAQRIVANKPDDKMAKFVNDNKTVSPEKLDVWWVSFLATGDEKYLTLVLAQTGDMKSRKGKSDLGRLIVIGAANWSFKSNIRQHPAVLKFAKKAVKDPKWKDQKEFLESCIAEASKPKEPDKI